MISYKCTLYHIPGLQIFGSFLLFNFIVNLQFKTSNDFNVRNQQKKLKDLLD